KNVEYTVEMKPRYLRAFHKFIISEDNKAIITYNFDPKRPKNRTVIIERNGKKIPVPYTVSFDKDGHKVIVSEPVPEK
ncbi:MAG: hypothetical protein AABY74_01020, partial [Planctomycetota bacterium]